MRRSPETSGPHRHPWDQGDARSTLALQFLALGLLTLALVQARYESGVPAQEQWVALAIGAAVISGTGNAWWLLTGRRAVARRRARLLGTGAPDPAGPAAEPGLLVAGAGMTRYHRPACTLVSGKDVDPAPRPTHDGAGRRPCDWCRP